MKVEVATCYVYCLGKLHAWYYGSRCTSSGKGGSQNEDTPRTLPCVGCVLFSEAPLTLTSWKFTWQKCPFYWNLLLFCDFTSPRQGATCESVKKMRVGTIVVYAACAVAAVSGSALRAPQAGRENPEFAKPISENQVTNELENEVAKATSVLNDGQEMDHNQAKNIYNGVISGWGKPNMVPTGYFHNAAG